MLFYKISQKYVIRDLLVLALAECGGIYKCDVIIEFFQ